MVKALKFFEVVAGALMLAVTAAGSAWGQVTAGGDELGADRPAMSIGANLYSHHPKPGFRSFTPGVYVRWAAPDASGYGAGVFRNSEGGVSVWAAHTWAYRPDGWTVSGAASVGLVTGYRAAPVLPLVLPSVAWHLGERSALRLTYVPRIKRSGSDALHLAFEQRFDGWTAK